MNENGKMNTSNVSFYITENLSIREIEKNNVRVAKNENISIESVTDRIIISIYGLNRPNQQMKIYN